MINRESIKNKFESINEAINSTNSTYGEKIANQLTGRVQDVINQFFEDFKEKSSKSFSNYWAEQKKVEDRFGKRKEIKVKSDMKKDKIAPKFISEYKNKK